jgi:hypothetical protein
MNQRYLNELASLIVGYYSSESIGNVGEDYSNVRDIIETKIGFLTDKSDEEYNDEVEVDAQ